MAVNREYCFKHQLLRPAGEQCGHCAAEAGATQLGADLVAEHLDLRRRVSALEHRMNDLQRAHNAAVTTDSGRRFIVECGDCGFREESSVARSYLSCPNCGAPAAREPLL
jgi:hypothetical protein